MIRRFWTYVSNNALLAAIIGGMVVLALGTWRWSDVKAFLVGVRNWVAGIGTWLLGTTEVYRLVLLADFLVLATVLAWAGMWWYRGRGAGTPVSVAAFNPTGVQLAAMATLLRNYAQTTTLAQLHEELKVLTERSGGKPFLARQMEELGRTDVVRIDETGRTDRSYSLTAEGRDWYLDQIEDAREHPDQGPQADPEVEPEESARFAPETFTLSGPRCRALLALLNRVDAITNLHDLHQSVTKRSGEYVDESTTKAQLQHDMDDAERAGLVRIEHVGNH